MWLTPKNGGTRWRVSEHRYKDAGGPEAVKQRGRQIDSMLFPGMTYLDCVSDRVMLACPFTMPAHRSARTSPRRAARPLAILTNIGRHKKPVATSASKRALDTSLTRADKVLATLNR